MASGCHALVGALLTSAFVAAHGTTRSAAPRRTQATEASDHDDAIAALCVSSQTGGATASVLQTGPYEVRVTSGGTADAMWLTNEYGDVIAFTSQAGSATTLHFLGAQPSSVTAHVHYNDCRTVTAQSVRDNPNRPDAMITWHALIQEHLTSDQSQAFGDPNDLYESGTTVWSASEKDQATPALATSDVDYAARRAVASFLVPNGKRVKIAYITGSDGVALTFTDVNLGGGGKTLTATFGELETQLHACAALCVGPSIDIHGDPLDVCAITTLRCSTASLLDALVAHLDGRSSASALSWSTADVAAHWKSDTVLVLDAPSDGSCGGSPPNDYAIYARNGPTTAFSASEPLLLRPERDTCDYTARSCSLSVTVVCGTSTSSPVRHSALVDLATTYASRTEPSPNGVPYDALGSSNCDHYRPHGSGATWVNGKGQTCGCYNGVPECGPTTDTTPYLNQVEAGLVAVSGFAIVCVLGVVLMRLYFARKEARTLPMEGKRRSVLFTTSADYVTTKTRRSHHGQDEVELPAPPSAGTGQASAAITSASASAEAAPGDEEQRA
eukprot:CAMPEP_0115856362 /NCGR_PEP_ID=MMETSP0287-20121206/15014_1 /TAXON_ID=412157 /ORGANISM="Chrysochromulina rotalis, Strain UIO044" /LENGTH=556 /DNA_ID=CAMNT_0003310535 /DNA_START=66 /DNA_END=1736 /DNA_ORIENTATION=+